VGLAHERLRSDVVRRARLGAQTRTVVCVGMQLQHVNNAGYVDGGTIMRLVDTAAGIAAVRHARRRVVTAAMDDMSFLAPVYIGDLVTVEAMVNDPHHTSIDRGSRRCRELTHRPTPACARHA